MLTRTENDLVVIASNAIELAEGQKATIEVMRQKESVALSELANAQELLAQAKKSKFSPKAANTLIGQCERRVLYLQKIREALEEGFVIVPNFPAKTIAIRVDRRKPAKKLTSAKRYVPSLPPQEAQILPVGDGRYVDPVPLKESLSVYEEVNGKSETRFKAYPSAFDENLELPVEFMKPVVIERTTAAMTRKIFDEIAITNDWDWPRRNDPMVIGRIKGANKKFTSFLIAWFIDTKEI